MSAEKSITYQAFLSLAAADPAVVGLVLKGSQAHEGMVTRYSDHDLYVILADGARTDLTRFAGHRTRELDLVVISLAEFRDARTPEFERYALARPRSCLIGSAGASHRSWPARRGAAPMKRSGPPLSGSTPMPTPCTAP
ncbi:MAG TPA: hypothetical protein VME19_15685 [Streptosporangiaceae bacterium]|nr:hypothetical protein [Streptosporangiaceae bacterium]